MASSGSFSTSVYDNCRYCTFSWWQISRDEGSGNWTKIGWELKGDGTTNVWYNSGPIYLTVAGTDYGDVCNGSRVQLTPGYILKTGETICYHDSNGNYTLSASCNASIWAYSPNCYGEGSWALNNIPRYAYFSKHEVARVSPNEIRIRYRPDRTITGVQYSLNGGSWKNITVISGTWNSSSSDTVYSISGLNPNTSYNVRTRIQYANNLWNNSGYLYPTTQDIARITEAPNFNIGTNPTCKFGSPPNDSTTRLYLERLDKSGGSRVEDISSTRDVSSKTSEILTYDGPTLYTKVPNSNTGYCRYCLVTNCNGTEYWHQVDREFYVTNSNPSLSLFNYAIIDSGTQDIMGVNSSYKPYTSTEDASKLIQGKTRLKFKVTGTTKNSATVKQYRVVVGSNTYYGSTTTGEVEIQTSSPVTASGNIVAYIEDSRGNTGTLTLPATVNAYSAPTPTVNTLKRKPMSVLDPNQDKYVVLNGTVTLPSYMVSAGFYKVWHRYRETGSNTWIDVTSAMTPTSISGGTLTFTNYTVATQFNVNKSYQIQIMVDDYYTTSTSIISSISISAPLLSKRVGKVGINKIPTQGALDVSGAIYTDSYSVVGTSLEVGTYLQFNSKMSDASVSMKFKKTDGTFDILRIVDGEIFLNSDELLAFEQVNSW